MNKTNKSFFKDDDFSKWADAIRSRTVKCKCGRSVVIGRKGMAICRTCGRMNFLNKKDEFNYRMRGKIKCSK